MFVSTKGSIQFVIYSKQLNFLKEKFYVFTQVMKRARPDKLTVFVSQFLNHVKQIYGIKFKNRTLYWREIQCEYIV